jgi:membrane protease YdiL (CAAX protease family)
MPINLAQQKKEFFIDMIERSTKYADENQIEQHSLPKSVFLHLLPAVIWIIFYIPLIRITNQKGIPTMLIMLITAVFTLLAFELGCLYYLGKKKNGKLSLRGVVLYRQKMPWQQYFLFGVLIAAWMMLTLIVGWELNEFIRKIFFSWIPDWYYLDRGAVGQNTLAVEISMAVLSLLVFGIIGPITEELYFRGYLLPRLSRYGKWAPLLNVILFVLYHFWQLHLLVLSIIGLLPMVYIVWRKRNVYLSIIVHCSTNLIGNIIMGVIQRFPSG